MQSLKNLKPIRRALVKIGKRDREHEDSFGYYDWLIEDIFLVRGWHEREMHVEAFLERNIEHETIHHVLYHRIGLEACLKFDNISLSLEFKPIKVEEIPDP